MFVKDQLYGQWIIQEAFLEVTAYTKVNDDEQITVGDAGIIIWKEGSYLLPHQKYETKIETIILKS